MKTKIAGLTFASAVLLGAADPAVAGGDVIYTGVKDPYAAAVPVPAPKPYPVYEAEYYLRIDTGAAWLSDGTLDEHGSSMEMRDIGDVEPLKFGSIGAGRYITPSIRAELAVELFTRGDLDRGEESFTETLNYDVGLADPDVVTYDVVRQEKTKFEQDIGMLNFYYDLRNSTRFTPYVGAGIGVVYRQISRTSSELANCSGLSNAGDPLRDSCGFNTGGPNSAAVTEETEVNKTWDVVGALMAGVAIQVTDDIQWDTGYRYMWQNGSISASSLTLAGTSRVELKDVGQHQLRTGLRFNLN
jgi:opacity protein-like surface antigen